MVWVISAGNRPQLMGRAGESLHHTMAPSRGFPLGLNTHPGCPHSSSLGWSKVDTALCTPNLVPPHESPQSQCLSCLSFPKSPLTPAQTPPSPAPLLLLPEPLERHPWVWRGLILPSCRAFPIRSFAAGLWGWVPAPPPWGCAQEQLRLRCWAHPMESKEHSWEPWPWGNWS